MMTRCCLLLVAVIHYSSGDQSALRNVTTSQRALIFSCQIAEIQLHAPIMVNHDEKYRKWVYERTIQLETGFDAWMGIVVYFLVIACKWDAGAPPLSILLQCQPAIPADFLQDHQRGRLQCQQSTPGP